MSSVSLSSFEQQRRSSRHEMRIIDAVLENLPTAASHIDEISKSIRPIIQVDATWLTLVPTESMEWGRLVACALSPLTTLQMYVGLGAQRTSDTRPDIQSAEEKYAFFEHGA